MCSNPQIMLKQIIFKKTLKKKRIILCVFYLNSPPNSTNSLYVDSFNFDFHSLTSDSTSSQLFNQMHLLSAIGTCLCHTFPFLLAFSMEYMPTLCLDQWMVSCKRHQADRAWCICRNWKAIYCWVSVDEHFIGKALLFVSTTSGKEII